MKKIWMLLLGVLLTLGACTTAEEPTPTPEPEPTAEPTAEPEPTEEPTAEPTEEPTAEPEPTEEPTPEPVVEDPIELVRQATIRIEATGSFVDYAAGEVNNVAGQGSGFIIDPSGIAVTNNHVVAGSAVLEVWLDGETEPRNAQILGVSECSDLAVIDIEGDGYTALPWYAETPTVGLSVFTAGYPLETTEFTLTRGIVSKASAGGETSWASVGGVLEHDATINPGNSGGPLVTEDAQVVGINYASNQTTGQYFAIGVEEAQGIVSTLQTGENVDSIGVNGEAFVNENGFSGIWVYAVESGSPAAEAGIQGGDIITSLEGLIVATDGTMTDYCDILRSRTATDVMAIEVYRDASSEYLAGELNGSALEFERSTFTEIVDDFDALAVTIPANWSDTITSPWTSDGDVIGAGITAAPSIDVMRESRAEPGIFVAASQLLVNRFSTASYLDIFDPSEESCAYAGRVAYDDGLYVGQYDLYEGCDGRTEGFLRLAAVPEDQAYMIVMTLQGFESTEEPFVQEVLNTFVVYGELPEPEFASGDIVYTTSFDDSFDPSTWIVSTLPSDGAYIAELRGERLYVEVQDIESTVYATYDTMQSFADVRLTSFVEKVAGPNRNNISLVCRFTDAGWYEFSMNSGGFWFIWKYSDAGGFTELASGTSNDINLQERPNELDAICQGNTFTFIINDVEVGSAQDSEFAAGSFGVSVTTFDISGAGVEFDWFDVIVP